jgi:hypothetical protein
MRIIALSGKAGTGKDYLHEHYLQPRGFQRVALADHFKLWIVGQGLATYEEVFFTKPPHVRELLQQEGTKRGRDVYGEDIWCNTLAAWLRHWERTWGMSSFAVTDVRFPNEVRYIQSLGGKVIRLVAPVRAAASTLSREAKQHISETALDDFTGFNGFLLNDPEDIGSVGEAVRRVLNVQGMATATIENALGTFHTGV